MTGESACGDIEMKLLLCIRLNHLQSLSMWNEDREQRNNSKATYQNSIMLPRVCYAVL